MVVGKLECAAQRGCQGRLQRSRLGGAQPRDLQIQALSDVMLALKGLGLVPVARDHQRPASEIAGIEPCPLPQLGDELRVVACAVDSEPQQWLLLGVGLGDGREHSRGDVGGSAPGAASLQHHHARASFSEPPRGRESDHAAPDHDHIKRFCSLWHGDQV